MTDEWRKVQLAQVALVTSGKRPPVVVKDALLDFSVPVIGGGGQCGFTNEALFDGEVLITGRVGTLGKLFAPNGPCWPSDNALVIRQRSLETHPSFLRYALQVVIAEAAGMNRGAANPLITQGDLGRLVIHHPPLPEQRAIAHTLSTLDDKLELNRRMSETLEAMARELFKSWFVNFDPVRAKMEGRWRRGQALPGLPAHLYDLFPDRLVDSELGEIPEGWGIETLGDHFDAVKGVSYKGSGLSNSGMPLHNLNSIYEGGGYKYEGIKFYKGEYTERHVVEPSDVIVANTEQGHDRLLIGYAAIVPRVFGERGIASHHIYRLRAKRNSGLTVSFLCYLLNSPHMHDIVSGYANGTTVNMLPIDGVQKPQVIIPPRTLVTAFDELATRSEERREEIIKESRTLIALRDTLLPKLISGELRVKDAEKFIGRAV